MTVAQQIAAIGTLLTPDIVAWGVAAISLTVLGISALWIMRLLRY